MTMRYDISPQADYPGINKLLEELGELVGAIGKFMAYPDGLHPTGRYTMDDLHDEIADVQAAIDFVQEACYLDTAFIDVRADAKLRRFRAWNGGSDEVVPAPMKADQRG